MPSFESGTREFRKSSASMTTTTKTSPPRGSTSGDVSFTVSSTVDTLGLEKGNFLCVEINKNKLILVFVSLCFTLCFTLCSTLCFTMLYFMLSTLILLLETEIDNTCISFGRNPKRVPKGQWPRNWANHSHHPMLESRLTCKSCRTPLGRKGGVGSQ